MKSRSGFLNEQQRKDYRGTHLQVLADLFEKAKERYNIKKQEADAKMEDSDSSDDEEDKFEILNELKISAADIVTEFNQYEIFRKTRSVDHEEELVKLKQDESNRYLIEKNKKLGTIVIYPTDAEPDENEDYGKEENYIQDARKRVNKRKERDSSERVGSGSGGGSSSNSSSDSE